MSFTYNGINCESFGMFVEKFPSRPFPTKKVTTYNILGRNGDLIVEHGGYNNVIQEYEVYVNGSGSGLQTNLAAIARWLLYGASGYAKLIDTYDPSIYREARVVGGEEFINSLNRFGKATLQFDCKPQRYPITDEEIVVPIPANATQDTPIPTTGLMPGKPLVKFEIPNFSLSASISASIVGGIGFSIEVDSSGSSATVYIDFENKTAYPGDSITDVAVRTMGSSKNTIEDGSLMRFYSSQTALATIFTRRWYL